MIFHLKIRMLNKNLLEIFLFLTFYATLFVDAIQHEQVHLSLGVNETEMIVTWVTLKDIDSNSKPLARYGKHGEPRDFQAIAQNTNFVEDSTKFNVFRAIMANLMPNTVYDYQVGENSNLSKVFSFTTHPKGSDWLPQILIYGDLGLQEGKSLPYLRDDIIQNTYSAIFHIGDFAYNLNDQNGKVGHEFMNSIEPVAATIPYMTCPGNHERHANFSHYDSRFSMLGDRDKPNILMPITERLNNHFYSLDTGPTHIIVFSSEYYFYPYYFSDYHIDRQYHWLEEDLKKANKNRQKRPWIIVMAHRPMYCFKIKDYSCNYEIMERTVLRQGILQNNGTRTWGLEDLFYKYGVDLQFYGHEHYYTRTLPVYNHTIAQYERNNEKINGTSFLNPKAPIHIITGSAGNKEHHPQFNPKVDSANWVGYHQPDYGYTKLLFKDKLKLVIEQISDDRNGKVTDKFEVIKTQHSPAWFF